MPNKKDDDKFPDSFVDKVVKDPANVPNVMLLSGFVGKSAEKDHTRLYLDAVLSNFYDIPDESILHQAQLPLQVNPLGADLLWVEQDAQFIVKGKSQEEERASFFSGDIVTNYARNYGPTAWYGCHHVGETGVQNCTQAPAVCGNTAWTGCPAEPVGPTGVENCTAAPDVCGNTSWKGCPKK
ncbi:MAG: hypothetical protein Q3M24_14245 [Candidatus Electrothrix aestuarii]|uniref:Uncharacterized protein n=1 Tax=Candidatus Electrothrix aestuarii TaxID=3062594 RepID=A0AAU8LQU8_9BACT|nr:hypothetical protein [Candidatus Electrothrix aestuarii]